MRYQLAVFVTSLLALPATALMPVASSAAEHFIASSVGTVDCKNFSGGVRAGDFITLAAGERGPLTISNCKGTAENPIVVRNDPSSSSPTVISRRSASSGGFIFDCRDCEYLVIDGTTYWKSAPNGSYCGAPEGRTGCGIRITSVARGDAPSTYLMIRGFSTRLIVRGVEIDGRRSDLDTRGVGIQQNDHSIKSSDHPDFWREEITYENNYVREVHGEGMYIGPNWSDGGARLRNITIRGNLVEDTGREGIQAKSVIGGANWIHHNVVRRVGLRYDTSGHGAGISMTQGGHNSKIFNNWVEAAGMQGIQHYNYNMPSSLGTFESEIFNNVIYDSGKVRGKDSGGHAISVGSQSGSARIKTAIYNNTVVKAAMRGIDVNSEVTDSVVRDNIVVDSAEQAISAGANVQLNNFTGSVDDVRFANPQARDFRLTLGSPARNTGSTSGFPSNDYLNVSRPQGSAPDRGAFEFFALDGIAPSAPQILTVE